MTSPGQPKAINLNNADLLSISRRNRRQRYLNQNIFLYWENIGKFLFMIFRSGFKLLMSIERFKYTQLLIYRNFEFKYGDEYIVE